MNEHTAMDNISNYKYRGAGVLVALHAEHMRRFLETWKKAKASGANLPRVDDPDYASYEALLHHVFRWSRTYLQWMCEKLDLPDPAIKPVPESGIKGSEADRYLAEVLCAWNGPFRDVDEASIFRSEFASPWGVTCSIEAMLEHAVMHPIRHVYQLEGLMERR